MSEAYTLVAGEEVIFEMNINSPTRLDNADNPVAFISAIIKKLLPAFCNKAAAILVVTNMRILITTNPTCCGGKNKFFWSFPRTALNGNNAFSLVAGKFACCDVYTISVGLSFGTHTDTAITFETDDVRTIEQAQALIAKFMQLSQV